MNPIISEKFEPLSFQFGDMYRDMDYVTNQCEYLVDQIIQKELHNEVRK